MRMLSQEISVELEAVVTRRDTNAKRISQALKITEGLGFTLSEQALILGFNEDVGWEQEYLERQLLLLGKESDVQRRCDVVITIDAILQKVHPNDAESRRRWINERFKCFHDQTMKQWIADGDLARLEHAVVELAYMTS